MGQVSHEQLRFLRHSDLEDDLILHDPWLFTKLAWFNQHVGDDKLRMPNRFEYGAGPGLRKLYVEAVDQLAASSRVLPEASARGFDSRSYWFSWKLWCHREKS
jgi:hypothetical protein